MKRKSPSVHYQPNQTGKTIEEKRIKNSAYFYEGDTRARLDRDKKAWITLAAGGSLDAYWKANKASSNEEIMKRTTPLQLLDFQIAQYSKIREFSILALNGEFLPYYHPKEAQDAKEAKLKGKKVTCSNKAKGRDKRQERIVVLRKCPSKALIKTLIPDDVKEDSGEHYNADREYARAMNSRGFDSRPEEDKVLEKLRDAGLDKDILVVFAFVVPFSPTTPWVKNTPPPEHTEQFAPYLKYIIASHSRASVIIAMDKWTARYALTRCSYEQLQYNPSPPDYGVPVLKLNLYPISSKTRNIKATGLKLINLPHACMWERNKSPELERAFKRGVERAQEGMRRKGKASISAFDMMFRASKDRMIHKASLEQSKAQAFEKTQKKTEHLPLVKVEVHFQQSSFPLPVATISKETLLLQALERANVTMDTDPSSIWLLTYDKNIWKIPERLRTFDSRFHKCDCPRCNKHEIYQTCQFMENKGDVGEESCLWCCCDHGHRNPMGECPQGKGCRGWTIPPLYNEKDIETYTLLKCHRLNIYRHQKFPTLEKLCVEAIRRRANVKTYDPFLNNLHRRTFSMLPGSLLNKWFRKCAEPDPRRSALVCLTKEMCCWECLAEKNGNSRGLPLEDDSSPVIMRFLHYGIKAMEQIGF